MTPDRGFSGRARYSAAFYPIYERDGSLWHLVVHWYGNLWGQHPDDDQFQTMCVDCAAKVSARRSSRDLAPNAYYLVGRCANGHPDARPEPGLGRCPVCGSLTFIVTRRVPPNLVDETLREVEGATRHERERTDNGKTRRAS